MSLLKRLGLCLVALLGCAAPAYAAEVAVAVAANFSAPMHKIAALFEADTGHKTRLAFGSTGRFYAQIQNGAPFDLLLAADADTPARLERMGLGVVGSRFTYAIGRLVLWSHQPDLVDDQGAVLKRGGFSKLAVANPKLAPYGAAAVETLSQLGLYDALKPRLVQGDSIAQAYQFVATENAELGFVALSQVQIDGRISAGSAWLVPDHLHTPIRQDALLLVKGQANSAASALLQYLRGAKARAVLQASGYAF